MDNQLFMPPFFAAGDAATGTPSAGNDTFSPTGDAHAANAIDRHPGVALLGLCAFYLAIVFAQASLKLLWADELITYYIAKQPGFSGVWHALQAGTDPNPPLLHLLVKASTAIFGGNALGMRLPSIACVLLAILAMWSLLRRWVNPTYALAGCLAFMATRGFDYAYDARSYAPMMGFAMVALALWMRAGDAGGVRRALLLAGMALALAAGVSSNYYCVLAFFPIAAGEIVARRFRPGVWAAMAVASLPLFAYLPLIRHNISEFGPHAWNRPQASMIALELPRTGRGRLLAGGRAGHLPLVAFARVSAQS